MAENLGAGEGQLEIERTTVDVDNDALQLDRREVVAGLVTAAVAASTVAHAQGAPKKPDIRIVRDPNRHHEIGVAIDYAPPAGDAVAIAFYPRVFAGVRRPRGRNANGPAYRDLEGFSFDDVTFSSRGKYKLDFNIKEAGGEYRIGATFGQVAASNVASAKPVDFVKFARGEEGLTFELSLSDAELFRWVLFGQRMEVKGPGGATLVLKLILPDPREAKSPWDVPLLSFEFAAKPNSKFWAFEGAVKFARLKIQKADSDRGDGANIQERQELAGFDKDAVTGGKKGTYKSRAWVGYADAEGGLEWDIGTARNAPSLISKQAGPKRYEIGNTRPGRKKPAIEVVQDSNPNRLTFRQWGSARRTLAILRSPMRVMLLAAHEKVVAKSGSAVPYPPAIFHLPDAMLTKQDVSEVKDASNEVKNAQIEEKIEETLVGRLDDKPFSVETLYGAFVVEGNPPPKKKATGKPGESPKPGQGETPADRADPLGLPLGRYLDFPQQPAKGLTHLHVSALSNELLSFDARGLLRHASVVMANTRRRPENEAIVDEPAQVWSRLDFSGTEIAFFLPFTGTGEQPWPSARGVVTLGDLPRTLPLLSSVPKLPLEQSAAAGAKKPEAPATPPPVAIALDGAHLQARRDSDNLALSFEFSRMVLELGGDCARITPNLRKSGGGLGESAWVEQVRRFDDRPLLIVHFPPQHVAERAYYRQVEDGVSLPDVPSSIQGLPDFAKQLAEWRKLADGPGADGVDQKLEKRKAIYAAERAAFTAATGPLKEQLDRSKLPELWDLTEATGKPDKWQDKVGSAKATLLTRWNKLPNKLPVDQLAFFLGTSSQAMDPDVRKLWLDIWRAYLQNGGMRAPDNPAIGLEEQLARLPDLVLDVSILDDIKRRLPNSGDKGEPNEVTRVGKYDPLVYDAAVKKEKEKRSEQFIAISELYQKRSAERPPALQSEYTGREALRAAWLKALDADKVKILQFVEQLAEGQADWLEKFLKVTPARLSGPSRLVFRFDAAGGALDEIDSTKSSQIGEDKEESRSIDFSFEGLTDWGRFDLAVHRRAETLEMKPGGRMPHPTMRAIDFDPARILAHQRIRPGRSIEGRLDDIRASLTPPAVEETAIELPFRLQLSPDQFARFRTRRTILRDVVRPIDPKEPGPHVAPPVLWSANLQIGEQTPVVRAIWSEDFRPGVFGGGTPTPVRGPHAPWRVAAKGVQGAGAFRTALDSYDRHEIVALSSVYGLPVMGRRNEFDNLVDGSQFEPPREYKLGQLLLFSSSSSEKKVDLSGIYNPSPLGKLRELRLTALGGSLQHDTTFTPPASAVRESSLLNKDKSNANLFDAFSVERWRQITVLGRDIEVEVVYKGFMYPLGIRATLVKITERRFIRNDATGFITAFLIQRKFIRIGNPKKAFPAIGQADGSRRFPVSELTMLTRETPDIVDPDLPATQNLGSLEPYPRFVFGVRPNGKVDFSDVNPLNYSARSPMPGLCFWPRTKPNQGGNISFEFKLEGQATPLRIPLLFVDNVATNNPEVMAALAAYYNWDRQLANGDDDTNTITNKALRTVTMGGARPRYADEKQDGECHFETYTWQLKAEGRKNQTDVDTVPWPDHNNDFVFHPLLQGSDQPPFYPYLSLANVRVGQAERFVGRSLPPCDVRFTKDYTLDGFPSAAVPQPSHLENYLEIAGNALALNMGDAGDRSGGIARPALDVKYLSRRYGLLSVDKLSQKNPAAVAAAAASAPPQQPADPDNGTPEAAPPPFDLTSFFKDADAKLLGIVSFKELLTTALGSAVPELKEKVEAATNDTAIFLQQTVLPEVERALKSLEEMWRTAQRTLMSQAGVTRGVASLNIDEVYPDIAPALHDLIKKVERAKASSGLDLIDSMSALQASGRRFVTAVNRTLADPITPLREELSGKFRLISQSIEQFTKGLGASVDAAIAALKDAVKAKIKEALLNRLEELRPFTRLLLAFPIPDAGIPHLPLPPQPQLLPATVALVVERVDKALAVGARALIEHVLDNGLPTPEETLWEALQAGLEAANNDLSEAGLPLGDPARAVIKAYKDAASDLLERLEDAADEFANQANAQTQAALEKVQRELMRQVAGALFPAVFGIEAIDGIAQQIKQAQELLADIGKRQDALESLPGKLADALKGVAQTLARQQFTSLCQSLGGRLATAAGAMLPPPQGVTGSLDALLSALDGVAQNFGNPHRDAADPIGKAMERYRKIRAYLTDTVVTDVCTADDPTSASNTVVAKVIPELTALRDDVGAYVSLVAADYAKQIINETDETAKAEAARRINVLLDELVIFVGAGADAAQAALQALRASITDPPGNSALNREIAAQFVAMRENLVRVEEALVTVKKMFQAARATNQVPAADAVRLLILGLSGVESSMDASLEDGLDHLRARLRQEFAVQEKILKAGVVSAMREIDDRIETLLRSILTTQQAAKTALITATRRLTVPIFEAVYIGIYKPTHQLRETSRKNLETASGSGGALKSLLESFAKMLRGPSGGPLADVFSVAPVDADPSKLDRLDHETDQVMKLGSEAAIGDDEFINGVIGFVDTWSNRTASPIILFSNLRQVLTAVLRGDLAQFVDLNQIRREVDEAIRKMVPARIKRSFDLKLKIGNLGELLMFNDTKLGLPKPHPKGLPETLVLRANGVIDVLRPQNSTYDAEGFLPGFALKILPGFDVATFLFPPTTFSGGQGKPFNLSLKVERVELGSKVQFLKDIQSILPAPKSGSGFYMRALTGRGGLGIVAGYALPVSPITIGNMFIDNLSLNIAAELPFDKGDARFVMSVSRPEAPFMISVAPYAGAGHFGLIANPKGIIGFEASFQFGGGGGFSFGPLTGKGRISVGVFVRKISGLTELYATFYAGGSARIACFGVGAQLYVRMSQQGGNVEGEAIFTFSFSIGIKDIEFSVAVYKREKGSADSGGTSGGGDGAFNDNPRNRTIDLAAGEYREVFAQAVTPRYARLVNKTQCMAEHFGTYNTYFTQRSVLLPGRKPLPNNPSTSSSIWIMP